MDLHRLDLNLQALRDALGNDRQRLLQGWKQCIKEMKTAEAARDLAGLARTDMAFHFQLFDACNNQYVCSAYELLRSQLTALRYRAPIADAIKSHQVLIDAAGVGDIAQACTLLTEHVLDNEPRYRAACSLSWAAGTGAQNTPFSKPPSASTFCPLM